MILFDQGGGGGGEGEARGKKVMDEVGAPVSLWLACFLLLFVQGIFLIFLQAQKYWWDTHLLDPLSTERSPLMWSQL